MSKNKINVALIGLGFGAEFIPIYQNHPQAQLVAVCQRSKDKLDAIGDQFGIDKRYQDYQELLKDPDIDAVHINTPIPNHAEQTIMALKAGKHVACTVPMATTVDECQEIVELVTDTGLTYMMMETVVYSREFLFVKEMYEQGEMGRIQFLRASHQQEMAGWPGYWEGLPPMYYATHCVSPLVALAGSDTETVSCVGSGRIAEELIPNYNSPFAIETCHMVFRNSDLSAEITRSLFNTARQYRESFDVYGEHRSFEWSLIEGNPHVIHVGEEPRLVDVPDYAHRLPEEIQQFTTRGVYDLDENTHLSFKQGSGHGGSHPHLAHEFITALINGRKPFPDERKSANITCTGILAHHSAMKGGACIRLPDFSFSRAGSQ